MSRLRDIMGLNAREKYIRKYNNIQAFKLANDKIYAREIMEQYDIPVPNLLYMIEKRKDIYNFNWEKLPKEFVIKPSQGSQGKGILILKHYKDNVYQRVDRTFITRDEIIRHLNHIIDGLYSLERSFDTVVIEERIKTHPCFETLDCYGLPDVRVIVVNMIPLMVMIRVPNKISRGKANIHQGGMAFGVDLKEGKIFHGISGNKTLTLTSKIRDFVLPDFDKILEYAIRAQEASRIGYLGVDITIDQDRGPLVIEVNAKPGLEIQNACLAPLKYRLKRIETLKVKNFQEGIKIARDLFAQGSMDYRYISNDTVIGAHEIVQIISKIGTIKEVQALVDLRKRKSTIEAELAKRIGFPTLSKSINLEFFIKGRKKKSELTLFDKKGEGEPSFILGRDDIEGFLIDTSLSKSKINKKSQHDTSKKIKYSKEEKDKIIVEVDKEVKLLSHLNPINLSEEREKFFNSKFTYNPQFLYKKQSFISDVLEARLDNIEFDESAFGILYAKKRAEIMKKIALLKARGKDEEFTSISKSLYGVPDDKILRFAKRLIKQKKAPHAEREELNTKEAYNEMEKYLQQYDLNSEIEIKDDMVARISATKNGKIFLKNGSKFSRATLRSTMVHEIDTHILTGYNGFRQDYKLLMQGMANYLKTQEGLAIYNQCSLSSDTIPDELYFISVNYLAVSKALTCDFVGLFKFLCEHGYDESRAFRTSVHMKRGLSDTSKKGAFTKSLVYLDGYKEIENYVKNKGDLKKLYVGKVALEDLNLVYQLNGLRDPVIIPEVIR